MQEVFIEQLSSIAALFPTLDGRSHSWEPQFVVSTHSSHLANRAQFSAIRYFRTVASENENGGIRAEALDLNQAHNLKADFLHQYLTLTRSDLYFADKAILVEGTSERLIVPAAIRKSAQKLANQYVTLLEVGGAYAHIFFPLLDFLGIPTLIITDIDTVGPQDDKTQKVRKPVHQGDATSNATIKQWFSGLEQTPSALLDAAENSAIVARARYLAYQIPEAAQEACGRSFEDAFILANPGIFGVSLSGDVDEDEANALEIAGNQKKSTFALRFAIEETDWATPRYIQRGLDWLLAYGTNEIAVAGPVGVAEATVR